MAIHLRHEAAHETTLKNFVICIYVSIPILIFTCTTNNHSYKDSRWRYLKVRYCGKDESIRLVGIDTPESRVNKKTKKDAKRSGQDIKTIIAMGKRATEYVESLVSPGDLITIEFDVQERDRYGRLLGYVYLSNSKMLNEEIVKAGYANVMTIPPDVKYKDRFLKAYQEARESKRGLWKEGVP